MWNTVKVFRQVRIDDVGVASADEPVHFLDSIGRIPTGSIAIGTAFQVLLSGPDSNSIRIQGKGQRQHSFTSLVIWAATREQAIFDLC